MIVFANILRSAISFPQKKGATTTNSDVLNRLVERSSNRQLVCVAPLDLIATTRFVNLNLSNLTLQAFIYNPILAKNACFSTKIMPSKGLFKRFGAFCNLLT
jgi:hypothetical protein